MTIFQHRIRVGLTLLLFTLFFAQATPLLLAQDAELKIGILYNHTQSLAMAMGKDRLENYSKAIALNGGRTVALLVTDEAATTLRKFQMLDGLLIPGGNDVDPSLYGELPHPKLETVERSFDNFEIELLRMADKRKMPVLGICKGLQIMNVFRGGTLIQDIPSETQNSGRFQHRREKATGSSEGESRLATHGVNIEAGSLLWQSLQARRILVPSLHHQAIERLGNGLRITARADDKVIEAIEGVDHPFFVGIQFHPEKALTAEPRFHKIFQALLTAAEGYRLTRKDHTH